MKISTFGYMPDGTPIKEFHMSRGALSVSIITYAGAIRTFYVGDTDIVYGYDDLEGYLRDDSHQGSLVGRYANRIRAGKFTLDGKEYTLECNSGEGKVHLHGGSRGYSRRVWEVDSYTDNSLTLKMDSPDGDAGYPGHVVVYVAYTLTPEGLCMDYTATTDKATPINLTNHAYFNLKGSHCDTVLDTLATIHATHYSVLDEDMIPVRRQAVEGTPFDFTTPHTIGERIDEAHLTYDNNFVLDPTVKEVSICGKMLRPAAKVENEKLALTLYTDQPCMQMYIGYFLRDDNPMKGGMPQTPHTSICLEAQTEPDGPNRGEAILRPGETYRQTTVYGITQK